MEQAASRLPGPRTCCLYCVRVHPASACPLLGRGSGAAEEISSAAPDPEKLWEYIQQQQAKLQATLSAELQLQATLSAEQQAKMEAKLSAELQQQATLSAEQQAKMEAKLQQQATQQAKETALSVVPRVFFAASQIIESICKSKSSLSSVTPSHMASSSPVGVGLAKAVGEPIPRLDQARILFRTVLKRTVRNNMAHPATRKALDAECAFLTRHLPVLE